MKRSFAITMHAPLGQRHGALTFEENDGKISGALLLLGNSDHVTGTITKDGRIEFTGNLISKLRTFSYVAKGKIENGHITLDVTGARYSFCITGDEIKSLEEKQ